MPRRILAFIFDINIAIVVTIASLFLASSFTLRSLFFSCLSYRFGQPFFISWYIVICLVIFGPLPMFLSFIASSRSLGQLFNGIREVDIATKRRIDILQALILSYSFVPSLLLFGVIPQTLALFTYENRTLIQWLASTQASVKDEKATDITFNSWIRVVCVLLSLTATAYIDSQLIFNSTIRRQGIMIGGTSEQRNEAFASAKVKRQENTTPELAFEALRKSLNTRQTNDLIEQFTLQGQMWISSKLRDNPVFEGLPNDLEYLRTEPISDTKVKIFCHGVNNGTALPKEAELLFIKEYNEWKFDVLDFQKRRYSQE